MSKDKNFGPLAYDVLNTFEKVADAAHEELIQGTGVSIASIANVNIATADAVRKTIASISSAKRDSLRTLRKEPAIARVVCLTEDDEKVVYFICRGTPFGNSSNLASYDAPIGSLASQDVGDEITLESGKTFELIEKVMLTPQIDNAKWDSSDSVIFSDNPRPITITSLRALLHSLPPAEVDDILQSILAAVNLDQNITEGIKRQTIETMSLRDRPVLDKYQNEIFRLPIDEQLIILGPPGTGKTTTLIKRLGQKLNRDYLTEHELGLVKRIESSGGEPHATSWLMFSPTDLLKEYLKEAFNREQVPAPDRNITTWDNYRLRIAEFPFAILKTAVGGGPFIVSNTSERLLKSTKLQLIDWLNAFKVEQHSMFVTELKRAADGLADSPIEKASVLGQRLKSVSDKEGARPSFGLFSSLAKENDLIRELVASFRAVTDKTIKDSLNLHLNRDREFLNQLADYLDELAETKDGRIDDVGLNEVDEEEEESSPVKTRIHEALRAYNGACRRIALDKISKRSVSKTTRIGKVIEWLGDRTVLPELQSDLGISLQAQRHARLFLNPVRRYIRRLPARYRTFRSQNQAEGNWYATDKFPTNQIAPLELDLLLCTALQFSQNLLQRAEIRRDLDNTTWSALNPVHELYHNQVLVDEATDFSALQLACMAALTNPLTQSFFACGDFNQRLTSWGAKSLDEIQWIYENIDVREVSIAYRQSKPLANLAQDLLDALGRSPSEISLPDYSDSKGYSPALLEHSENGDNLVHWLSERIVEIYKNIGQLPSIAIFVNSESDVRPLSETLGKALTEFSIGVEACENGKVRGQDNNVRVFDIQHIKGLEFEAVFFVGVDELARKEPELFGKYLYVGITRAATYLGLTCQQELPNKIEFTRSAFVENWA